MLFEDALYYPTIDIENEAWLKSAALLWNHIFTIVPKSEHKPYKNDCSREFYGARILFPHRVEPSDLYFPELEDEVREYLKTKEGKKAFKRPNHIRHVEDWNDRITREIRSDKMREQYGEFCISIEKFGLGLRDALREYVNDDGYVIASRPFMNFYMTGLANNLCHRGQLALLTDLVYTSELSESMMKNIPNQRIGADMMKQGVMYKYILQGIKVDPDTPIDKIIQFREKYQHEIRSFRMQVTDLVNTQNMDGLTAEEIKTQVARLYKMGVLPALKNIEKAMDGQKMKWISDESTNIAVSVISALITQSPIIPLIPLMQEGLKMLCRGFNYNSGREDLLIEKPFSLLYRINKQFKSR